MRRKDMETPEMLDQMEARELSDHLAMVKTKLAGLSMKELRVLFVHYFDDRGRGVPKLNMIADLAEALMFDPKSPLFFERQ